MRKKLNLESLILIFLLLISITTTVVLIYFGKHLLYGDSLSRLNISRKIIDNLVPGFAQIGNVWLPLPQILTLPLNMNYYLWQSGISGAVMNVSFFVLGGWWLYKAALFITSSKKASIAGLLIYALNINLLYLQSTAMSEVIFIALCIGSTYYLLQWTKSLKINDLLLSAFLISCATLVRYEALILLISFSLAVLLYSLLVDKYRKSAEGFFFLFVTLASLGFGLWTLYLWIIFGDPLFWKNYYIDAKPNTETIKTTTGIFLTLLNSTKTYITSVIWMNGIIPFLLSVAGSVLVLYDLLRKKKWELLPIGALFSLFVFMVLTISRNTPVQQPELSISNILSFNTNYFNEFNIRYGLIMVPFIALTISYLLKKVNRVGMLLFGIVFSIQILNYVNHSYTSIYQIPVHIWAVKAQGGERNIAFINWMKNNYDEGLILISASRFDPQMFQLGFQYKTYIHEGTGGFWKESLINPTLHAKWVVLDKQANLSGVVDMVDRRMVNKKILSKNYDLVFEEEGITVYKIKSK